MYCLGFVTTSSQWLHFRCTVLADETHNVVGMGDGANKKDAEKLAALSAMFQLHQLGLVRTPFIFYSYLLII